MTSSAAVLLVKDVVAAANYYDCRDFGIQDLDGYDIGFGRIMRDLKRS